MRSASLIRFHAAFVCAAVLFGSAAAQDWGRAVWLTYKPIVVKSGKHLEALKNRETTRLFIDKRSVFFNTELEDAGCVAENLWGSETHRRITNEGRKLHRLSIVVLSVGRNFFVGLAANIGDLASSMKDDPPDQRYVVAAIRPEYGSIGPLVRIGEQFFCVLSQLD